MPHDIDVNRIVRLLERESIVSRVDILLVDEIEKRGFYKLRVSLLPSRYKLDIKFIRMEKELLYSYQFYEQQALARWDNEPHYPDLENYPHHFHHPDGKVEQSNLSGKPAKDLAIIFVSLAKLITKGQ